MSGQTIAIVVMLLALWTLIWSPGNLLSWGVVVVCVAYLVNQPAAAHDHTRPENNEWLKSLHSANKTWCCNGDDTDAIEDWEASGKRYRVKFRGQWFDVPDSSLVDGPNRGGDALLWMNKGALGYSVRCFMPGSLT